MTKRILGGTIAVVLLCLASSCSLPNTRVHFYGRVVDQNTNAIPDVKISAMVRHWHQPDIVGFYFGASEIRITAKTDKDGRFKLRGTSGDALDLEYVQKGGYELEPGQRSFGVMGGSVENPVVFKMWSTNIHEQLITGSKSFHIVPDGKPYFIDLTKDEISQAESGDLKVWVKYPEQVERGQSYPWSCKIDVIQGGLLEEPLGTAMYMAPAEGYVPSFSLQQQIREGQRGSIGDRPFYVMLNNGKVFGRIQIDLIAPYNMGIPGMIRLSYAINPSGSHILR